MRLDKFVDNKRGNDEHIDEMTKILKRDCSKYLNHVGEYCYKNGWVYRAVKEVSREGTLLKKKSYLDVGRNTRLSGLYIQELFNNAGNKAFGWNIRDGVSTGTDPLLLGVFGQVKIFLPIGNYEFVWEPRVYDFNQNLFDRIREFLLAQEEINSWMTLYKRWYKSRAEAEECQRILQPVIDEFVKANFTDKNLQAAIKGRGEIDFKCTSYYLVLDEDVFYEAYNRGWG